MKKNVFRNHLLLFALGALLWGCSGQQANRGETKMLEITDSANEDVIYELGAIAVGQEKELVLTLKNMADKPVIINEVRIFCGCTIPELQPEPILPQASSDLKIRYIADHLGVFSKSVRVYLSNQKDAFDVKFTGEVTQTLQ
ncbi:DUF1573 domain-containing protein [Sunxiuqinia sp. sy24]|uniref:DUF1573 domain-containing protein n=1 Tax=Sunxiuqinia sp. sy24 TaxID=3461495 RepID=UPI004045DDFC